MPPRVIAGCTALVTGGGRGIGRAICEALVREGLDVVVVDLDLAAAESTVAALREMPGARGARLLARQLDVSDLEAFVALVAEVETTLAPLDVLVANAGIMALGPFLAQAPALDDRQLDVNLRGVSNGLRAALPGMLRRRRGHLVHVASVAGRIGVPNAATYSATKHAVVGLSEAVRHELRDSGVDLSWVLPALVDTDLTSGTRGLRWPPRVTPARVAEAVVEALRTGRVDLYVPPVARLAVVLPALLPRGFVERVGRWLGVDRVFAELDEQARSAYQARLERAVTSPTTGPRTPR